MTHELILTSVAQGLDPSDHGFCPVAADSFISPRVLQHLLTLNGDRHLMTMPVRSPVVYSHLQLPGGIEHVLSRVADAGSDDQQRPNILAHHIVLDGIESPPESPAWLLALPGFHLTQWVDPPLRFLQGRPLPTLITPPSLTRRQQIARQSRWLDPQKMALSGSVDTESESYRAAVRRNDEQATLAAPPTTPCPTWEEMTGDPGWGGVLADSAFTDQPVVLIYKSGQNILPLFVEALALLPLYFSWRTTFCTYFTGLPVEIPCQWKGVLAGSQEAQQLAGNPSNLVLDFTTPMGTPPEGKYVEFARLGQEYLLPVDAEDQITTLITTEDTKPYGETKRTAGTTAKPAPLPPIQLPKARTGISELFLRRASRFQFYFLYSIMFIMVLILLVLAIEQSSDIGILQRLQPWNKASVPAPDEPKQVIEDARDTEVESPLDRESEQEGEAVHEKTQRSIFEEEREKQRIPLLQLLETFDVPESLALYFPNVQDNGHIDLPEKRTFAELCPLQPFGAALELRFIPLFVLPHLRVHTHLDMDALPRLVWKVEAIDLETREGTPMFLFQLTESGLEMEWALEGLSNQHLYDTLLSSLGFLQLNVSEMSESTTQIPLFAPDKLGPMWVSDLAKLSESETPEFVVGLPFASELWGEVFREMDPPRTIVLEVRAEPEGDWVQVESVSSAVVLAEVRTSQQAGKLTESGETLFEKIAIPFVATASLEKIVWKASAYAERLQAEQETLKSSQTELKQRMNQLKGKRFDGAATEADQLALEQYEAELKTSEVRLKEIENIVEKLPDAYKEIGQNESARFHYSVFLESTGGERKLLLLTTVEEEIGDRR